MKSSVPSKSVRGAFGLVELLITLAVIGVIAAITAPIVGKIFDASNNAKARMNAKNLQTMSESLASLGVAHVIPESLGGVEATARLMRHGVIVPDGPMAGEKFIMAALSDKDIVDMAKFLRVRYDKYELKLEFYDPEAGIGEAGFLFDPSILIARF